MIDPLALTAEQSALIRAGASAVPPRWRQRFLAAVADLLTLRPNPTNRDVATAVSAARRTLALGVSPPSLD
jgi:hypothetical protein